MSNKGKKVNRTQILFVNQPATRLIIQ
uniref:Uncharacterized protein n=1 Tax=Rhizophora mucronata TaxID=61149 RepID=A0A2P2PPN1_RHIMU